MPLWTSPENTFPNKVSLSISVVFCILAALLTTFSCLVSTLDDFLIFFFMSPPSAPIIMGKTIKVYPRLLSLISRGSCSYRISLSLHFVSIFYCMGHTMLQIQICFSSCISSIKLDHVSVSVFSPYRSPKPSTCSNCSLYTPCQLQSACVLSLK